MTYTCEESPLPNISLQFFGKVFLACFMAFVTLETGGFAAYFCNSQGVPFRFSALSYIYFCNPCIIYKILVYLVSLWYNMPYASVAKFSHPKHRKIASKCNIYHLG